MKLLKSLAVFLVIVVGIITILMLVMPVKQTTQRSIVINAKPAIVYEYLSMLSNFNKWAVWNQVDSSLINTITGTDGTLGAINNWKGEPSLSGEGRIEITSLEINQEIEHRIEFISPKQMNAEAEFDLVEVNGQTKVVWTFELSTPRPKNIFNLFSSLDNKMGNDFDKSLQMLKSNIEKNTGAIQPKSYEVMPFNFPATTFAYRRQQLKWTEIPAFMEQQLPYLYDEAIKLKATPGSPSGLYFVWDETGQQTDMAVAVPVAAGTVFADTTIKVMTLPGSKALYTDYYGAYDKSADAYASIDKYIAANKLTQKAPVIEQYITDPKMEKDTTKWLTKIIFLVE